jgi:hypothetical protein
MQAVSGKASGIDSIRNRCRRVVMPHYRIYLINCDDDFVGVQNVASLTDADALAHARAMVTIERGVEVWEQARFVGRIEPEMEADALSRAVLSDLGTRSGASPRCS